LYLVWKKLWRLQSNNLILIITSFIASSVERVLGKATIPIRYSVWIHSCTEYQQLFEKSLVSRWRRIDFIWHQHSWWGKDDGVAARRTILCPYRLPYLHNLLTNIRKNNL